MPAVSSPPVRAASVGDWVLMTAVALILAWTTLCLGGFLAETMVWTSRAVWLVTIAALLRTACGSRSEPVRLHWAVLVPVPFLLYALASVLWRAPAEWLGWREWLVWLQAWLVFGLVLHGARGRGPTGVLVVTLTGLALIGVGMAAYQRFVAPEWIMLGRKQAMYLIGRSAGTFGSPNSLAGQLELLVPVCVVLLASRAVSVAAKILCGWLAVALVFALVLTGSRGGWIALGAALLAWPLLAGGDWRKRVLGTVVIIALLAGTFTALYRYSPPVRDRLQPMLAGQFELTRPLIWKAGWQIWQTAPWLGTGAASYNVLFNQYRPKGFVDIPRWTHNEYLNILGDYGLVGFVLWTGAGVAVMALGWRAVRRARRATVPGGDLFVLWRWKFGLWLGLLAFAVHLVVDFHWRLPALACMAATIAALVLRDEATGLVSLPRTIGMRVACVMGVLAIGGLWWGRADALYRAEAVRFEPMREISRAARAGSDFMPALGPALDAARRATEIYPRDGQAWADYAHAMAMSWHIHRGDGFMQGLLAEQAARRALALCPEIAEYWVRLGVAQDMIANRAQARASFERAIQLAPNNGEVWYYYAYHLAHSPGEDVAAAQAVATCLDLDPGNRQGLALRERLQARNLRN